MRESSVNHITGQLQIPCVCKVTWTHL